MSSFGSSQLDTVTFSLRIWRAVFMEILLMMCLGKSYFLNNNNINNKNAEIVLTLVDC